MHNWTIGLYEDSSLTAPEFFAPDEDDDDLFDAEDDEDEWDFEDDDDEDDEIELDEDDL